MSDPGNGVWFVKWGFALFPIALGIAFQLLTLWIAVRFIHARIRKLSSARTSGFPLVGPLLISAGLWWAPDEIPAWLFVLPWAIEIIIGVVAVSVQKATATSAAGTALQGDRK